MTAVKTFGWIPDLDIGRTIRRFNLYTRHARIARLPPSGAQIAPDVIESSVSS